MSQVLPAAPLDLAAVLHHLGAQGERFIIDWREACASTNSELLDAPPPDDGRVHVCVAERQTAGRGRRGRNWLAWQGGSLCFSGLWRFDAGAPVPAGLSLVAGLAVARALESLGVPAVRLKWPNDVLIDGAKLAGILVELLPGRGRTPAAVVGIGINLRLPEGAQIPDQPAVTDLARVLGDIPSRERLLAALLGELDALFSLYASAGFSALRNAWMQRNAHAGQIVRIVGEGEVREGECVGVDDDGALLLRRQTPSGARVERILSGEVSLRGA